MSGSSAQVEMLERAIKEHTNTKSGFGNQAKQVRLVERTFQDFDRDGTGTIDEEEFLAALVRMNIVGCTDAALELFDKFDEDMSGCVSYREFSRALFPAEAVEEESKVGGPGHQSQGSQRSQRSQREASDVVARVKQRILQLAGKNAGIRSVTRILRQMDEDGNKMLNASELKEGMLAFGVTVSPPELELLMRHFDRDGSGRITVDEFLRGLRGSMTRPRRRLVRLAWDQLVSHLQLDGPDDAVSLAALAGFYDVSQNPRVADGSLSPEDAMRQFMAHWDKNGDDTVEWREFLDYYKDLSAGVDSDDYFELMIRNAWHLRGGQGWAEETTCLRALVTFMNGEQRVVAIENDFGLSRAQASSTELIRLLKNQGITEPISDATIEG